MFKLKSISANGERDQKMEKEMKHPIEDSIQFPRMIAMLDDMDAFTPEVMHALRDSMDLEFSDLIAIIERAKNVWKSA